MLPYNFSKFMFVLTVLFVFSKVNCQNCGHRGTGNGPVSMGGESPTDGEWPWMVTITIRASSGGDYTFHCTGFLIDRIHVLAAAHCFDAKDGKYSTRIGKVNQKEGETYTIDRITVHDGYEPGMYYDDIAVLTLTREVDIPDFNPVCLPDAELSRQDLTDLDTTLVGWGRKEQRGSVSNYLMQLSGISIMSNKQCNRKFREVVTSFRRLFPDGIDGGFICAALAGEDAESCRFVSGGPLMHKERSRWFVVGSVSFGSPCNRPDVPSGYIRISEYLDWIKENTRD